MDEERLGRNSANFVTMPCHFISLVVTSLHIPVFVGHIQYCKLMYLTKTYVKGCYC